MQKTKTSMPQWYSRVTFITLFFFIPSLVIAECETSIGHFASLQSTVDLQRNNTSTWQAAKLSDELCEGDTIRVGKKSRAAVQLANDAVLRLDQNTTMRLLHVSGDPKERSFLEVLKGVFQSFSRKPHHLTVQTPYLNGLIEGTEYLVRVDADQASILLMEGKIIAKNDQGSVTILPGQSAVAKQGEAPKSVLVVKPMDAVQWALHYPALLNFNVADYPAGPGWKDAVRQSVEFYNQGDLTKAFSSIADIPDTLPEARFFVYRASLLLTVGRVDDARKDLEHALKLSPHDSDALALRTIIAVAQNANDQALTFANQAVQAGPKSATAYIALSYAQQANFDLEAARASLEKAVQLDPKNALAWARLAEIYSSFHLLGPSHEAAEKAVALDPNLSRTQSVLGFADLTRFDMANAKVAFNKAINLDQTDPLPHLGLGLAKIADGDLSGGRRELDVAAILDPNKSIIRSYLGKAYYEEKRDDLANQQYDIAKKLDPKDPTPWFYDAIAKQTQNQPVEALNNMNQAIALNDNRAVYRSKLLLDSDLAARSAAQARIYSDLGFQDLALVQGWQSVNTDPTNFSAHRFLSDSYQALPNHEIARVSELLQSQLLQPLNLSPIQPHLAESNLFLISSSGPATASYNEFNPLFYRNGTAMQFSGLVAGNDTSSEEAVISGVHNNVGYSIGGLHFQTDGFRPNADQHNDIANAFVQMDISPDTSIQAEFRYGHTDRGDVQLKFFPDEYNIGERTYDYTHSYRFGARHNFSPNSTLLLSVVYMDAHFQTAQDPSVPLSDGLSNLFPFPITASIFSDEPQKSWTEELQYLYRTSGFNVISGLGHFDRDSTATVTTTTVPDLGFPVVGPTDTSLKHSNAYVYSNMHVLDNLVLTLGLSGEFTGNNPVSVDTANDGDQYNPKFGLMWTPYKDTLVRLAAFRTSKRPVVANQTLEPTQVAGFNQFYDDYNGTVSKRYGAAVDQTFSHTLYGGLEVSRRDLDVPYANPDLTTVDWVEELQRAYLFWTPKSWLGLRMEYQYQHLNRDEFTDGIQNANTYRLLLGMNVYLPSGWSFSLTPTYYDQKGTFESYVNPGVLNSGQDNFWIVDAAIRYRLPKRHGFISAGVKNMFNQDFMYYDTNYKNPTIQTGQVFFAGATLALP